MSPDLSTGSNSWFDDSIWLFFSFLASFWWAFERMSRQKTKNWSLSSSLKPLTTVHSQSSEICESFSIYPFELLIRNLMKSSLFCISFK